MKVLQGYDGPDGLGAGVSTSSREAAAAGTRATQAAYADYMRRTADELRRCGHTDLSRISDPAWRNPALEECRAQRASSRHSLNTVVLVVGSIGAVGVLGFVAYKLLSR